MPSPGLDWTGLILIILMLKDVPKAPCIYHSSSSSSVAAVKTALCGPGQ